MTKSSVTSPPLYPDCIDGQIHIKANTIWAKALNAASVSAELATVAHNYIGCFALAHYNAGPAGTVVTYGTTVSGASLYPCATGQPVSGPPLPGSWRCLGYVDAGATNDTRNTLWQRVA